MYDHVDSIWCPNIQKVLIIGNKVPYFTKSAMEALMPIFFACIFQFACEWTRCGRSPVTFAEILFPNLN